MERGALEFRAVIGVEDLTGTKTHDEVSEDVTDVVGVFILKRP